MKKAIPYWQMVGFVFTAVVGTFLHFLFDWTGGNVVVALFSAVNESRLGFRTLKIQKESREVYKILVQFKTQFTNFVGDLEKAQEQIGKVNKTLEDAKKRTNTIKEKLDKTDSLTMPDETPVLPPVD